MYPSMHWAGGCVSQHALDRGCVSQHALGRGCLPGVFCLGVSAWGCLARGCVADTPGTRSRHPPVDRQITCEKTSFAGGKNLLCTLMGHTLHGGGVFDS